jgi:quinone-modifying oxidoreductase subunit QmoB
MTAALETAAADYPVHLVCAEGKLGGIWGEQYNRVASRAAAAGVPNGNRLDLPMAEEPGVEEMAARFLADPRTTVHVTTKLAKTTGAPGPSVADIAVEPSGTIAGDQPQVCPGHPRPPGYGETAL